MQIHQIVLLILTLLKLDLIVADRDYLCPHTQYCNGGDLADYLQGKHHTNLSATRAHTHTQIIGHQNKVTNATEEQIHVTVAILNVGR